jgi:hypothetical protein
MIEHFKSPISLITLILYGYFRSGFRVRCLKCFLVLYIPLRRMPFSKIFSLGNRHLISR